MKALLIIALFILTCSFKIGYDWAQAWVEGQPLPERDLPKSVRKKVKDPGLALVLLTKKDLITTPSNGNSYLRCYLINNTDTTTIIQRSDATVTSFGTEILKDNTWQKFQHSLGSDCEGSYWNQNLRSKEVLSIQLDHNESGPIAVPFRIKYYHNGRMIYSNVITVNIDEKNYDRVGKRK